MSDNIDQGEIMMEPVVEHLNREHSQLPFLDALRGTMCFWVLAGHTLAMAGMTLPVLSHVALAVDIFMFVSGFLMTYYFRVREDREPWEAPATWRAFYLRRFFRIAPAYYGFLLIALVFREWYHAAVFAILSHYPMGFTFSADLPPLGWQDILTHATFTFGLFQKYAASNALPDWSIGLEMQFYLALPFIMLLYKRAGHLVSTALLLALWAAANMVFAIYSGPPKLLGIYPEPSFLPLKLNCFAIGILLAECYYFKSRDARKGVLLCLFSIGVAIATTTKCQVLVTLLSVLMLVYPGESVVSGNAGRFLGWLRGVLGSRPCRFLADTSYSVYLLHLLVLFPLAARLTAKPWFLRLPGLRRYFLLLGIMILIVYPISFLVHKFVERPGIALGRQLVRRYRPAASVRG